MKQVQNKPISQVCVLLDVEPKLEVLLLACVSRRGPVTREKLTK